MRATTTSAAAILVLAFVCLLNVAVARSSLSSSFQRLHSVDANRQVLQLIKDSVETKSSAFHHASYNRLAYLVDTFGTRLWGSASLELAIKELAQEIEDDQVSVRLEPVSNFTKWVRGPESLTLYSPRPFPQNIKLIGLGCSVSGNVTAEAIVVTSFDDLDAKAKKVAGKIVVYAVPWTNYEETVKYRSRGADSAAKYGAVAVLVRSITPFSIESPHTGGVWYSGSTDAQGNVIPKIPAAAIAVEDAEMFLRMHKRGQKIVFNLSMENEFVPNANSFNVIAELKGSEFPEQILVLGGHIDSWDTGSQTGANDDGGGFVSCYEALRLIQKLGLRPKRTIRFIAWSGEEYGGSQSGASQYARDHQDEMDNHVIAFESDLGSRTPVAWGFSGNAEGLKYFEEIASLYFEPIYGMNKVVDGEGEMVDSSYIGDYGVPMIRNIVQDTPNNDFYFTFHHSAGDSMTIMDADQLDQNVVAIASMFYILADADIRIPRD